MPRFSVFGPNDTAVTSRALLTRVYDITNYKNNGWLDKLTVVRITHTTGHTPSRALLSLRMGSSGTGDSEVAMDQAFNNPALDSTMFDAYLEKDIVIMGMDRSDEHFHPNETENAKWYVLFRGTITNVPTGFHAAGEAVQFIAQDHRWKWANHSPTELRISTKAGNAGDADFVVLDSSSRFVLNPRGEGNCHYYTDSDNPGEIMGYLLAPPRTRTTANGWTLGRFLLLCSQNSPGCASDYKMPQTQQDVIDGRSLINETKMEYYLNAWSAARDLIGDTMYQDTDEEWLMSSGSNDPQLPTVDLTGLNWPETVTRVCRSIWYTWWLESPNESVDTLGLSKFMPSMPHVIVIPYHRSDDGGRTKVMRLPERGSYSVSRATSWPSRGSVNIGVAGSVNHVIAYGREKEYEAQWVLTKGWNANDQGVIDAATTKGQVNHPDYITQAETRTLHHVYRHWVLDEDGTYGTATGTSQCTTIFGSGDYIRQRRKFYAPYTAPGGKHKQVTVWVQSATASPAGTDGNWAKVGATGTQARNMPDRCGISFELNCIDNEDNGSLVKCALDDAPNDPIKCKVALNDIDEVKVTATLRHEDRVKGETTNDADTRAANHRITRVINHPRYRYVVQNASSDYATTTTTVVDDTTNLQAIATKSDDATRDAACSASFIIPWVDTSWTLNQRVWGLGEDDPSVTGRDLSYQTNRDYDNPHYPRVVRITHEFNPGQRTELLLSDIREGIL